MVFIPHKLSEMGFSSFSWMWIWEGSNQDVPSLLVFLIAILAFSFWYIWTLGKSRKTTAPLPPGPHGLPLVGYLPFLRNDLHLAFTELAAIYGPIFRLQLGRKLFVIISSPLLAKEVVRIQDKTFSERDPAIAAQVISYNCNDIAFDSYSSPNWKKKRRILSSQVLTNANLNACYILRRERVMKTLRDVYENAGKPIDIGELAFATVTNAVMAMLWGDKLPRDKGDIIEGRMKEFSTELMVLLGKPNLSDFFPMLARLDIQGVEKRMKKVFVSFDQVIDSVIELRMNMATENEKDDRIEQKDFIQHLLELKDNEDSASGITVSELKGILADTLVGGTDTTSTMIEWSMAELMQHPKIMKKVKKELAEVVGLNNMVEETHLPNLGYLQAVIKETFRLHPPLPLLVPRSPCLSTTVGGYTVPKGCSVFLNMWAIHKDPNIWDNPLEFQPERFLNSTDKFDYYGNDFRFMPFGSGRRMCPGVLLAERMLHFTLASLLHSFEWELPQGKELDLSSRFGIVTKIKKPLVLIPTPRFPLILSSI